MSATSGHGGNGGKGKLRETREHGSTEKWKTETARSQQMKRRAGDAKQCSRRAQGYTFHPHPSVAGSGWPLVGPRMGVVTDGRRQL
uniref:HDC12506 n=1 Tax=Drosophila melanogaster TaxID=7227 RepID=Q6IKG4_DROME|nr:TPA_inf: HDC12506 [Drosophila melanogaster]